MGDQSAVDGILVNVIQVARKILRITDAVIGESALPDFSTATNHPAELVRRSTFDKLDCMLERNVVGWSEQEMHMLRHDYEGVQLKSALAVISIYRLEE